MSDYIAKNGLKTLVIPTASTTNGTAVKFFPENILLLKKDHFEAFLIGVKLTEWWMIIQATVTQNEFLKNKKDDLQYLNKHSYQLNQWSYGFEIFTTHYPIIKHLMFRRIIELE